MLDKGCDEDGGGRAGTGLGEGLGFTGERIGNGEEDRTVGMLVFVPGFPCHHRCRHPSALFWIGALHPYLTSILLLNEQARRATWRSLGYS